MWDAPYLWATHIVPGLWSSLPPFVFRVWIVELYYTIAVASSIVTLMMGPSTCGGVGKSALVRPKRWCGEGGETNSDATRRLLLLEQIPRQRTNSSTRSKSFHLLAAALLRLRHLLPHSLVIVS